MNYEDEVLYCTKCNDKINATGYDYYITNTMKRCQTTCDFTFLLFYSEELGCDDHCPEDLRYYMPASKYCVE